MLQQISCRHREIRARLWPALLAILACAAFHDIAWAQTNYAKLRSQYEAETDPIRKAKVLAKLGSFEIDDVRDNLKMGEDEKALSLLEMYRDEVKATAAVLTSSGIDAERHSAGFKELQISLRQSIRRMDATILTLPVDKRPFFEAVRSELAQMQTSLFDALFPTPEPRGQTDNARGSR